MGFIIVLLTVFIVLDCLLLVLLVLMQLPKKDAGVGLAFGGAATDALFGAGSGNFLTKATKYAATTFFVLALVLSILKRNSYLSSDTAFRHSVEQESQRNPAAAPATSPSAAPTTTPAATPEAADSGSHSLIVPAGTNATPPK